MGLVVDKVTFRQVIFFPVHLFASMLHAHSFIRHQCYILLATDIIK